MRAKLVSILIVLCLGGGALALFVVQNASRTTQLSFDLGAVAWQLDQPIQVPLVIGLSVLIGLLSGVVLMGPRLLRLGGQVRRLERQLALSDQSGDEWPTT
jgi:uncharacterized integral membrane protein